VTHPGGTSQEIIAFDEENMQAIEAHEEITVEAIASVVATARRHARRVGHVEAFGEWLLGRYRSWRPRPLLQRHHANTGEPLTPT
jgi:hypothetical protein